MTLNIFDLLPIALYRPRRLGASFTTSLWHRNPAGQLTLASCALAGALTTSITPLNRQDSNLEMTALDPVRNVTVVYKQVGRSQTDAEQDHSQPPYTEQVEAADQLVEDNDAPLDFRRAVRTVRFANRDVPVDISTVTTAARESIQRAMVKVESMVGLTPKTNVGVDASRKQAELIADQVDGYLWDVYQRVPTKKDGTGDFTWKDPAAAKHMGLPLKDYVIGGMDPEFREQLYHAGRAMDAAGLQWSMLSAFRDDYRQGLASGFKASVSNSMHGGSSRTGGYGHGRAIDITGPEGKETEVWDWIDAHGAKYGLHRPLPGRDPAHVQQHGDWHKIALALRESRTGAATGDRAKSRKTAVAAVR